jgi:tRNA-modifying protein YgfZ
VTHLALAEDLSEDLILTADAVEQVIEVTGEDRLNHLDATTTQALKDARPGTATAALALDANGNPLAAFDVLVLPDRLWLITPAADVTDVVMRIIAGRTFLADARFTVLDQVVARAAVGQELASRAFAGTAVVPDAGTVRSTPSGDTAIVRSHSAALLTIAGPAAEVGRLLDRLRSAGAVDADAARSEQWRIAAGLPAWGRELAPPHLPEELGLLPSHVHLAKGCYPGQEAVARMWMLGRPRRRLAQVRIRGIDGPIAPGSTIGVGRAAVEVTSIDPEDPADGDGRIALAFVPGTAAVGDVLSQEGGAPVDGAQDDGVPTAADVTVEVLTLPGDDPTPPGHDPAMRRRRDRPAGDGPPRRAPQPA